MLRKAFSPATMRKDEYQAKLGMLLFLASIGVFFAAGLVGFAVLRFASTDTSIDVGGFPISLLVSTACMFGVSSSLYQAVGAIRKERQSQFLRWLSAGMLAAFAFTVFQSIGIHELASQMYRSSESQLTYLSRGLIATITIIHILHVLGGLIALALIYLRARKGNYDHEKHFSIDLCASYWRFLDFVWVTILITLFLSR